MATKRVFITGERLAIDGETGELVVKVSGNPAQSSDVAAVAAAINAPATALATSTAIAAGDATIPATWLAALTTAQLTLTSTQNGIVIEPAGTERTVYVAHLDNATWRHYALVTVPAYSAAIVSCKRKGLAFGVAGGGTVNVSGATL
jgi:hypothetical protein